jgi:hypothetical protein
MTASATPLVVAAFRQANIRHASLHQSWVEISHRVGGLLPRSLLGASIQRFGELDLLIRCMEDEFHSLPGDNEAIDLFKAHYLLILSELWIGSVYEAFRLIKERKLIAQEEQFINIEHDLRILRIPLEKHQIAADSKLSQPLQMQSIPPNNDATDLYEYSKGDPKRTHIMPTGISARGAAMWQVIDLIRNDNRWIERRDLSDRVLSLWRVRPEPA